MDTASSLSSRLRACWSNLAERMFGDAAEDTARGEITSAFISERNLADYVARENARRNARRPPAA
jgi:hypothetical protein